MKGFEIIHNGKKTTIGVENGLSVIHIDTVDVAGRKDAYLYSCHVNRETKTKDVWHNTPISVGDEIEIKMVEIEQADTPIKSISDYTISQPVSKLERFHELETLLKKKGLL